MIRRAAPKRLGTRRPSKPKAKMLALGPTRASASERGNGRYLRTPAGRSRRIAFSNGSRREALRGVDAFGCLRSLRARSALDGVSWVQRGLVEIAVGPRLTACYEIRAVVCSLPRASLLLGAGFGLLSRGLRGLGERELRSVSQHRVHNDREATSQSDPSLSHR
jgi:hypothetical protein